MIEGCLRAKMPVTAGISRGCFKLSFCSHTNNQNERQKSLFFMNLQKIPVLNTISFKNSYGFSLFGFAGFIAKSYADTQCFISHFLRHPVE